MTSDGGLLLVRELDEPLGLSELIAEHLTDPRGKNTQLPMADLLRQAADLLLQVAYLLSQAADLPTVHNAPDPPHDPPDQDQNRDSDLRSRRECFPARLPKAWVKELVNCRTPSRSTQR